MATAQARADLRHASRLLSCRLLLRLCLLQLWLRTLLSMAWLSWLWQCPKALLWRSRCWLGLLLLLLLLLWGLHDRGAAGWTALLPLQPGPACRGQNMD